MLTSRLSMRPSQDLVSKNGGLPSGKITHLFSIEHESVLCRRTVPAKDHVTGGKWSSRLRLTGRAKLHQFSKATVKCMESTQEHLRPYLRLGPLHHMRAVLHCESLTNSTKSSRSYVVTLPEVARRLRRARVCMPGLPFPERVQAGPADLVLTVSQWLTATPWPKPRQKHSTNCVACGYVEDFPVVAANEDEIESRKALETDFRLNMGNSRSFFAIQFDFHADGSGLILQYHHIQKMHGTFAWRLANEDLTYESKAFPESTSRGKRFG